MIRAVKQLITDFVVRKRIKIILLVVTIINVLSVISYSVLSPGLQVKGSLIGATPAAPMFLIAIGLAVLFPLTTILYFLMIRKSQLAKVSPPFQRYVKRVGYGVLAFLLSGVFCGLVAIWNGTSSNGYSQLLSNFFLYLGYSGIFASIIAILWKETPSNHLSDTPKPVTEVNPESTHSHPVAMSFNEATSIPLSRIEEKRSGAAG